MADAIHAEWSLRFRNELLRLRTVRVGGDALVLKWQRMMMRKIVLYGRKLVEKSMVDTSDAAQGHHGRGSQILKTDDRWMVRRVMTGCVAERLRLLFRRWGCKKLCGEGGTGSLQHEAACCLSPSLYLCVR